MVDLSETEDRPVETSSARPMSPEVLEEASNSTLADYTGASIRVLEGIEAIRLSPCNVHRRYPSAWTASLGERGC